MGKTVTIYADVYVDTDEILEKLSVDELRDELRRRRADDDDREGRYVLEVDRNRLLYDRVAWKRTLCDLLDLPYTADNEAIVSRLQSCRGCNRVCHDSSVQSGHISFQAVGGDCRPRP